MIESNPNYKYVACCICQSRTTRAHRLPALSTNEDKLLRYAKWVNFAAIENVYNKKKYFWVCEIHFEDNAFCNHLKLKILRTAIPTLNPPIYEGPCTEDGSPSIPTETKDETLMKVFQEVVDRQCRNEPVRPKRRFYNFISTSPGEIDSTTISKEKENSLGTNVEGNHHANDAVTSPVIMYSVASSPDGSFKISQKTTNTQEKAGCIKKDRSASTSTPFSQRARPLILRKSPTSSKLRSSIVLSSSVDVSDLLKSFSSTDTSMNLMSDSDNPPVNHESASNLVEIVEKISAVNNKKTGAVGDNPNENLNCVENNINNENVNNNEDINLSPGNESTREVTYSELSVVNLSENKNDKQLDILSAAINNSDILVPETSCMDEVVSNDKENHNQQNQTMKHIKKQPATKKYYDPVLIDSVLNKMKLKKSGPICVVTLEKKPDKLFKGLSKSKLVTLYKQQIKKNRKNQKANQAISKNGNDITKKNRKKRRCTCSLHCHRRLNGSKISPPISNINSGVGVKFEGTAVDLNVMNIVPDLAEEELFNVENVFNISTILTNVHDKSQVEQLCQMLIECIFKLKSLNIEGTMAKLQVYIAQVPENGVNRSADDEVTLACNINETSQNDTSSQNTEINQVTESNYVNEPEVIISSFNENDGNQIQSFINLTNEKEMTLNNKVPVTTEVQSVNDTINVKSLSPKPKNVKVRLSTFHDHSYLKPESNYIFEKPEYLVKLINTETYRCPRKAVKPPPSGISKKEIERHKKACLKLNKRIMHLREAIKKKNKNIQTMHRKIKYLGGIVCKEKGIKRVKYPKAHENIQEITDKNGSEECLNTKRTEEAKVLIDMNIDQLRMDNAVSFDEMSYFQDNMQIKPKKTHGSKTKKNNSIESFDVLYENLIEELCCNEL